MLDLDNWEKPLLTIQHDGRIKVLLRDLPVWVSELQLACFIQLVKVLSAAMPKTVRDGVQRRIRTHGPDWGSETSFFFLAWPW